MIQLTPHIRNKLIGFLIRSSHYKYFKTAPITRLMYHSDITVYMKEKYISELYNDDDKNEICAEWLIDIHDYINSPEFSLKKFKREFPEELI